MPEAVIVAQPQDLVCWDPYVSAHAEGSVFLTTTWKRVVSATYGHEAFYLLLREGSAIRGVLSLFLIRGALFGRVLASSPYGSWGGLCSDTPEGATALIDRAIELGRELGVKYVELKNVRASGHASLATYAKYLNYELSLSDAPEVWAKQLSGRARRGVRKAEKSGLTYSCGRDLLDDFYELMASNMRRLGTPVHSKAFYRNILEAFGGAADVLVVKHERLPIAALLLIQHGSRMYYLAGASRTSHWNMNPNNLAMWVAIKGACEKGLKVFDFGRSLEGGGTAEFKEQWGSTPVKLHYQYYLNRATSVPEINPANPRFRWAVAAWRRLPLRLTKTMGPVLIKGVP